MSVVLVFVGIGAQNLVRTYLVGTWQPAGKPANTLYTNVHVCVSYGWNDPNVLRSMVVYVVMVWMLWCQHVLASVFLFACAICL